MQASDVVAMQPEILNLDDLMVGLEDQKEIWRSSNCGQCAGLKYQTTGFNSRGLHHKVGW